MDDSFDRLNGGETVSEQQAGGREPYNLVDGKYAITDLVDLDQLRDLFEKFSQATGCTIGFLDHPGLNVLIATAWRPICTQFHRSCPEAAEVCIRSNRHLLDRFDQPGQIFIETCDHGLVDCATPIIIKGKHLASLATGQMLLAQPDRERFRRQARRFGFDEQEYLNALDEIPVVPEEKIRLITAFLGSMAHLISQLGYKRLTEIAEREQAAAAIQESEARLKAIVEQSPISMVVAGPEGVIEYLNRKAVATFGYSLDEISHMNQWWHLAFPDPVYRREVVATWTDLTEKAFREGHEIEGREYRVTCRDRAVKIMFIFGVPIADKVLVIFEDVTARRHAEDLLMESSRRLELAVTAAKMGIWDWDIRENRMTWDDQMFRLYGIEERLEPCGVDIWTNGLYPDDKVFAWKTFQAALHGDGFYDSEFRIRYPDGTVRYIKADGIVLHDKDGKPVRMLGVNYDITERKLTENRLHQAEKMDAIGQLAGGVAHDFNNMLGGIIGAAELISLKLERGEDPSSYVSIILNAAKRAAELTNKLLAFARKQPMASTLIDINVPLRDTIALYESTAHRRVRVHADLDHNALMVVGDLTQFQNAFLNLLINSAHSMPEGGSIFISSSKTEINEHYCKASTFDLIPGLYAEVEIRDTGCGIAPEHLSHIFEPFFTTKEKGKGTGLGLAAVLGTVQQYKGAITVYSEVGTGTSIHLLFPLSEKGRLEQEPVVKESITGRGTILIVDDENVMRATAAEILAVLGYEVLLAEDGLKGLELFKQENNRIGLVILDMIMPELSGRDCFFAMREINPDVRVVLSSGFSREEELQSMKTAGLKGFIHKPYRISELSRIVHEAMNDSQ